MPTRTLMPRWIKRLLSSGTYAWPKRPPDRWSDQLFPDLFVRQLEERRVLSVAPLAWDDIVEPITIDAGSCADDGQADTFEISRQGDELKVSVNGDEVYSGAIGQTAGITVNGSGDDDTLIVNLSGGDPLPAGGITFNGMGQSDGGTDSLLIQGRPIGGQIDTVAHRFEQIGDGSINLTFSQSGAATTAPAILYSGTEAIGDRTGADNFLFEMAAPGESVSITDAGAEGDALLQISSSGGTSVTFLSPGESLSVDAGAAGTLTVSGSIDVSNANAGQTGGTVHLLGDRVILADGASIDASGAAGGGEILIGGDYQGANPEVRNASFTDVEADVVIAADALRSGDGGTVVVWADDTTTLAGTILARGGALAGDGGGVEISGKTNLSVTGHADLTAPAGNVGHLLLDPGGVKIEHPLPGDPRPGDGGPLVNTFFDTWINSQLLLGNLTITTADSLDGLPEDLRVLGPSFIIIPVNRTLELVGNKSVTVDATAIIIGQGSLTLTGGAVTVNSFISLPLGTITTSGTTLDTTSADIIADRLLANHSDTAALGKTTVYDFLSVTAGGAITDTNSITVGGDAVFNAGAGSISLIGSVVSTKGNVELNADDVAIDTSTALVRAKTGVVTIRNASAGREIDLGTETAGKLSITDAELDRVTALVVRIGRNDAAASGTLEVTAAINAAGTDTLHLSSGGDVHDGASGSITEDKLAAEAVGKVDLDNSGFNVGTVAARSSTDKVNLRDSAGIVVGSVDGLDGVGSDTSTVTLRATTGGVRIMNTSAAADVGAAGLISITLDEPDAVFAIDTGAKVETSADGVLVQSDNIQLDGTIVAAGQKVTVRPNQPGAAIVLGNNPVSAGTLELDDAELDNVTAGVLVVGGTTTGPIAVTGKIDPALTGTLHLVSGSTVTQTAEILQTNLAVESVGTATLTNANNDVDVLAAKITGAGAGFSYLDKDALSIGTADGLSGVSTAAGGAISVATVNSLLTVDQSVTAGTSGTVTLDAGTNQIAVNKTVSSSSGGIALTSDQIAIAAAISSSGKLALQPKTTSQSIGINDTGTYNLSTAEIALLTEGFSEIRIGRTDGTHTVEIGPASFKDSLLVSSPNPGGSITVSGKLDTLPSTGPADIELKATRSEINLNADLATSGGSIRLDGPVTLENTNVVVDTDTTLATGDLDFTNTLDGSHNLTLRVGGATTFSAAVGGTTPLGSGTGAALAIDSTGTTTFESTVRTASGIVQTDAAHTNLNDVAFERDVTVLSGGDTASRFDGDLVLGIPAVPVMTFTEQTESPPDVGLTLGDGLGSDVVTIASADHVDVITTGLLDIVNGTVLESSTGKVTNAPPLLRIGELDPDKVLVPGDPVQEIAGSFGGIETLGDNLEQGANFTLRVTWDDGVVNTITGLNAGDKIDVLYGPDGSIVPQEDAFGTPIPVVTPGSGTGPIELLIRREYGTEYLATVELEVMAVVEIDNDPAIRLYDGISRDLNWVDDVVITTVAGDQFIGRGLPMELDKRVIVAFEDESTAAPEVRPVALQLSTRLEEAQAQAEAVAEEVRELYVVRVFPNGKEGDKQPLSAESLADILTLLETFKEKKLPNGLYRLYLKEFGFPPRKVMEFYKSDDSIGDPVREKGRGSNESTEDSVRIDRPRNFVREAAELHEATDAVDTDTALKPLPLLDIDRVDEVKPVVAGPDVETAQPDTADDRVDAVDQSTGPVAGTVMAGGGAAVVSAFVQWEKRIDRAMESSDEKSFTKQARLLRRFRR